MHKIWENWPEALRVGAPGDKILHLSPSLWGGGGGGWGGASSANEGAETKTLLELANNHASRSLN